MAGGAELHPIEEGGRVYGGLTAEQRTAARRERLIDAGIEVFGTEGYSGATVRGVIRASGLGERYFYENFEDLDDLLGAVCERIHEEVLSESLVAVADAGEDPLNQVHAGLTAFIGAMVRDPRKARIKLLEMSGAGPEVRERRREGMNAMAELMVERMPDIALPEGIDINLITLGLVGAVNELLVDWFISGGKGGIEPLVNNCMVLFAGALMLATQQEDARG